MKTQCISILIPTYNAGVFIDSLLIKIFDQELEANQSIEVIIVDSSSSDDTEMRIKKFPEVKFISIQNKNFDHGGTRNFLASMAKGNYLLFMTQDAIPYDNHLIKNLLKPLNDSSVMIAYARQIPNENASILEQFARNFNYPAKSLIKGEENISTLGIKAFFNSNVCSIYKRSAFETYKGFPEKIILNEDMILASKVIFNGKKVAYEAEAKVYHSHNYSLIQQFKRYFDIGMAFNQTSYLLEEVSNEKEGLIMIKKQLNYLIEHKKSYLILYAIIENFMKFLGYNLGKRHFALPNKIRNLMSAYMK